MGLPGDAVRPRFGCGFGAGTRSSSRPRGEDASCSARKDFAGTTAAPRPGRSTAGAGHTRRMRTSWSPSARSGSRSASPGLCLRTNRGRARPTTGSFRRPPASSGEASPAPAGLPGNAGVPPAFFLSPMARTERAGPDGKGPLRRPFPATGAVRARRSGPRRRGGRGGRGPRSRWPPPPARPRLRCP